MNQRKVCLLGAYAVGKTSLVSRFVHSIFSEKYQTTIGVQVDHKTVRVGEAELALVIWDLAGEDRFHRVETSYLRGSGGYLLVIDGCRPETLDEALRLDQRAREALGEVPVVYAINKVDREAEWRLDPDQLGQLDQRGVPLFRTSARTGAEVEPAFQELASRMLAR